MKYSQITGFLRFAPIAGFLSIVISMFIITSCGNSDPDGFTVVKDVKVGKDINVPMAETGAKIFKDKCTACHKYAEKYVGPAIGMVTKRRGPDYIMSQIMHPEQMIKNNDTVKALMAIYPTQMANQHLNMNEARAVLEHLRAVAENGGK